MVPMVVEDPVLGCMVLEYHSNSMRPFFAYLAVMVDEHFRNDEKKKSSTHLKHMFSL